MALNNYTVARRFGLNVRVARTISYSFAALSREILFLPPEHNIYILLRTNINVFVFLFHKHTDDGVFDDFPKIFQNCCEGQTNVIEYFPRISERFRKCPKISNIVEDLQGRAEDVSMIHLRI